MRQGQPPATDQERTRRPGYGELIAFGLGGGAALGAAFGAFERGALLGLLAATLLNAFLEWREGASGGTTALAISAVGTVVVLAILFWT